MRHITRLALAASALTMISISVAAAADLGPAVIDPEPVPEPPAALGGWYLRGDISYDFETKGTLFVTTSACSSCDTFIDTDFDDAWNIGVGLGYTFNDWFRADITGDIRTPAHWEDADTDVAISTIMLNGYATLGSFSGISPYVGAGLGGAHVNWSSITVPLIGPVGVYTNDPLWRFAYALMAGVSFDVTENLAIDAGYRFTAIDDGRMVYDDPAFPGLVDYMDMQLHEFRIGARYTFGGL